MSAPSHCSWDKRFQQGLQGFVCFTYVSKITSCQSLPSLYCSHTHPPLYSPMPISHILAIPLPKPSPHLCSLLLSPNRKPSLTSHSKFSPPIICSKYPKLFSLQSFSSIFCTAVASSFIHSVSH